MAIAPITSVSFRNNYNQINFESSKKKKKKSSNLHIPAGVKAVPLAAMIAMSPLNNVNAQNDNLRRYQKTYSNVLKTDIVSGDYDLTVGFWDEDGDPSNVETIDAVSSVTEINIENHKFNPNSRYEIPPSIIRSLNDYEYTIIGSDGKPFGILTYSQLILDNNLEISKAEVVEDIRKFAESDKNNGAISIKKIKRDLIPGAYRGLRPDDGILPFDTVEWKKEVKNHPHDFGTKIKQEQVKTEQGNYKIDFYSSGKNKNHCDALVLTRDDGLKFKLDAIQQYDLTFATNDGNLDEKVTIPVINISWPDISHRNLAIFDTTLFNTLYEFTKKENLNYAFDVMVTDRKVSVDADGANMTTIPGGEKIMYYIE